MEDKRYCLEQVAQRLGRVHPRRRLNDWLQRLDDAQASLVRCVKLGARRQRLVWQNLAERLRRVRPELILKQRHESFVQAKRRLDEQVRRQVETRRNVFSALEARLRLLGPEQVLARGYSITTDAVTGQVLREAREVKSGQRLKTRLKAGEVFSQVEESPG